VLYIARAQQTDTLPFKQMSSFRFKYENDVFCGEDQYYTQGILFEYKAAFFEKSPLSKSLIRLKKGSQNEFGLSLRQDVYTPKSIRNKTVDLDDRPYAAVLFASQLLTSINYESKTRLTTKLDVGVIGPLGFGEQEQKFIHKQIADVQPIGWEYQIANSPIVNYNLLYEKGIIDTKYFEFTGIAGGIVGVLNTNAEVGGMMRLGKMRSYFKSRERKRGVEFYATLQGSVKAVGYNAIIQGLPWIKSPHTLSYNELEPLVYRSNFGLTMALKKFSITYFKFNTTKEIKKGLPHAWGSIQFMGWFK
jgi:lipid A 3-O-deacylase